MVHDHQKLKKSQQSIPSDVVMSLKSSCGRGRFSNFSIAKLLEKGSKDDEKEEKEELEKGEGGEDDGARLLADEDCEIKQEKIELLGGAELSGCNY